MRYSTQKHIQKNFNSGKPLNFQPEQIGEVLEQLEIGELLKKVNAINAGGHLILCLIRFCGNVQ